MSILKLDVGKPLTLAVDDAKIAEGKFGKQAAFHAGDDVFFMSLDTASRQLDRLGLSLTNAAGNTLRFEKVAKGGKTFINIDFFNEKRAPSTAGSPPAAQPPAPSTQEPKPTPAVQAPALYTRITRFVLDEIVPLYVEAGIQPTANDIHAMVSTIYITASKR